MYLNWTHPFWNRRDYATIPVTLSLHRAKHSCLGGCLLLWNPRSTGCCNNPRDATTKLLWVYTKFLSSLAIFCYPVEKSGKSIYWCFRQVQMLEGGYSPPLDLCFALATNQLCDVRAHWPVVGVVFRKLPTLSFSPWALQSSQTMLLCWWRHCSCLWLLLLLPLRKNIEWYYSYTFLYLFSHCLLITKSEQSWEFIQIILVLCRCW